MLDADRAAGDHRDSREDRRCKDRDDQMAALRKLALRITWDGQAEAGRVVPAGRLLRHRAGRESLQVAYHRA